MSSGEKRDTRTGLYYFDRFGNLELLYRDAEASCMYPIPLEPRPSPPRRVSPPADELSDEGEFLLSDVQQSFFPLPAGRTVKQLRIFQVLPKTHTHVANQPRLGYANAESARMLLGTVPVEEDGSAYFRVPARKPLYFQAVDADGRAVQTMRSVTYLQARRKARLRGLPRAARDRGCQSCPACRAPPALAIARRPRGDPAAELSAAGPAGAGPALRALPRWAGRSRKKPARIDRPSAGRVHAELPESEAVGALERMGRGLAERDYHPPGTLRRGPEPADASARRRESRSANFVCPRKTSAGSICGWMQTLRFTARTPSRSDWPSCEANLSRRRPFNRARLTESTSPSRVGDWLGRGAGDSWLTTNDHLHGQAFECNWGCHRRRCPSTAGDRGYAKDQGVAVHSVQFIRSGAGTRLAAALRRL